MNIQHKMKNIVQEKANDQLKEHCIEVYRLMAEVGYMSLNLDFGNGYTMYVELGTKEPEEKPNLDDRILVVRNGGNNANNRTPTKGTFRS